MPFHFSILLLEFQNRSMASARDRFIKNHALVDSASPKLESMIDETLRVRETRCNLGRPATKRNGYSNSVIGFAVGSAKRIGRPTLERFCFIGSSPKATHIVANRS
jgi:hypothetical protein